MTIEVHIDLKKLQGMMPFAPENHVKDSMNGLRIESTSEGQTTIVGCDFAVLGALRNCRPEALQNDVAEPCGFTIPPQVLAMLKKTRKDFAPVVTVLVQPMGSCTLRTMDGTMIPFKSGDYPPWARLLPGSEETEEALPPAFNWQLLDPFIKANKALGSKTFPGNFDIRFRGAKSAVITFPVVPDFIGLAMPRSGAK